MEFRHLRYFVAVVEERQFVRAAAVLHIAQSALSQQIRDLERELGAELLHRDRRGVTVTPAGEVLLGHARGLLEHADLARAEVAQLTGVISGTLRVGSGSPSGPVPLPATLAEFQRRHPAVDIVLRDAASEELVRALQDGSLDIAVVSFAAEHLPERVRGVLITREPMVALVPAAHRLAAHRTISLVALGGEPLITYPRGAGIRDTIEDGFHAAGVARPAVTAETIDPLAMLELVGQGLGCSLMPRSVADHAGADVAVVALRRPGLRRNVTLAWAHEHRTRPAVDAFLELAAAWIPGSRST
jgi:DNA-binding transcriptional LysR family regulator